jgi:hypothetical protein
MTAHVEAAAQPGRGLTLRVLMLVLLPMLAVAAMLFGYIQLEASAAARAEAQLSALQGRQSQLRAAVETIDTAKGALQTAVGHFTEAHAAGLAMRRPDAEATQRLLTEANRRAGALRQATEAMRAEAAIEIIGVSASATMSIIASEFGVMVEPTITSTLSSVSSLRVFFTAVVVSVASSRTM